MPYSTVAMVRSALAPGEYDMNNPPDTPTNTAADLSNAQLSDAIAEADSTIDGWINPIYDTPVLNDPATNATPHPIDYWSRDLAIYFATLVRRKGADFADTDPVARRYSQVMLQLQAVGKGLVKLSLPSSGTLTEMGAGPVTNPYVGNLFTVEDFGIVQDNRPGAGIGIFGRGYGPWSW